MLKLITTLVLGLGLVAGGVGYSALTSASEGGCCPCCEPGCFCCSDGFCRCVDGCCDACPASNNKAAT